MIDEVKQHGNKLVDEVKSLWGYHIFKIGIILALLISFSYVAWTEIVTGPLNSTPVGSKATGLPYPFLNDMVLADRLVFYAISIVTGIFFYFLFWFIDRVCLSYFWGLSK